MSVDSNKDPARPVSLWGAIRRGCYPHRMAWLLDLPVRRLIIRPEELADRLQVTAASRILEVGPGPGYFSAELARRVPQGRLELLDLQPQMLARARRKFSEEPPPHVGFTAADACGPLPYGEGSFDLVVLVTVLGELPSPRAALRSLHRVLAPGGRLAIHEHQPDPDFIPFGELTSLVENLGFRFVCKFGRAWNYTANFERPHPDGRPFRSAPSSKKPL